MAASGTSNTNPVVSPLKDESWSANYLNTTENHLRRLRLRGEIPHVRLGRFVRFHLDDLDAFIDSQRNA